MRAHVVGRCLSLALLAVSVAAPVARAAPVPPGDSVSLVRENTRMSYNIQQNRIASEVRAALPQLITDALRSAPKEEADQIQLTGQVITYALDGVHDDDLIELQAYGANTPSTGAKSFFVSMNTKQVKARAEETAVAVKPWTPDDGPFARRAAATVVPTPGTIDTTAATPATPVATGATPATPATTTTSPVSPGTGTARSG